MPAPDPPEMGVLAVTNLFPNPLEPQRSTFNERQLLALGERLRLHVLAPVSWILKLRHRLSGRHALLRDCRDWRGVPASYPTYWYVPRLLAGWRGHMMHASIGAAIRRIARQTRPRAILATWAFPDGYAAVKAGRALGLPVFVKVHGTDVERLALPDLQARLAIAGLQGARGVVSVSLYLRDRLVAAGIAPERIHVVYNGIDAGTFHPRDRAAMRAELGLPESGRLLLYVGSLKPDKGVRELLDPQVQEGLRAQGATLAIAGAGELRGELERAIASRGLQDRVRLLGPQRPAEVARWMNAADALCLPSHHEGIPNVILEALACGLPVLATRVGGIPEVVDERNGILVPMQDPAALAGGVTAMFSRHWDRAAVAASCPARSWADSAAALEAVIRTGLD